MPLDTQVSLTLSAFEWVIIKASLQTIDVFDLYEDAPLGANILIKGTIRKIADALAPLEPLVNTPA